MRVRHAAIAITGASGAVYGLRLTEELLKGGLRVSLLISRCGFVVLKEECGLDWGGDESCVAGELQRYFGAEAGSLAYYADDDFLAPIASGSSAPDAMVVCPCTMGTVSRIACGHSASLLERCADVMLKERRMLVMVPRETPLSEIHLENMLRLARMGARIVPAMPAFYHRPASVAELVNFLVGKVLDQLGIPHELFDRWGNKGA